MSKSKEELMELRKEYVSLTEKLKELSDDELFEVTGGNGNERREKTVAINIDITSLEGDVDFKFYVDGVLQGQKSVDATVVNSITYYVKGVQGIVQLTVKANDFYYKSYEIDFDSLTYKEK